MKIKKKIQTPVEIVEKVVCDKCGCDISMEDNYEVFQFEFSIRIGESYQRGGGTFGEKIEIDLCKKHAIEAVKLLEENGFKFNKSEWD